MKRVSTKLLPLACDELIPVSWLIHTALFIVRACKQQLSFRVFGRLVSFKWEGIPFLESCACSWILVYCSNLASLGSRWWNLFLDVTNSYSSVYIIKNYYWSKRKIMLLEIILQLLSFIFLWFFYFFFFLIFFNLWNCYIFTTHNRILFDYKILYENIIYFIYCEWFTFYLFILL